MASLPRNPPDCIILDNLLFDNLISVHKLFAKALPIFATCLLVNNNSCEKLILLSELSIIFDDNLKTTSVFLCVSVCVCVCVCVCVFADFNLSSCEFDSFTFKLLYCAILYW